MTTAGRIHGIGTDIVQISRIRDSLERFGDRFARRILTPAELEAFYASPRPERFMSKRFAAKEAVVKAMGLGFRDGVTPSQIGVTHDALGRPGVEYLATARQWVRRAGIVDSLLSLSDERDYVVAYALLWRADD